MNLLFESAEANWIELRDSASEAQQNRVV